MFIEDAASTIGKRKLHHGDAENKACTKATRALCVADDSANKAKWPAQGSPKRLCLKRPQSRHCASKPNAAQCHRADSSTPIAPLLLRPCHVCWRRPTTWAVLDAYADCEACGGRSCYICLRECEDDNCKFATVDIRDESAGPDLERYAGKVRRRRLCSLCTVEDIGADGVDMIRCLDCADVVETKRSYGCH
jgi:hypothetical protein